MIQTKVFRISRRNAIWLSVLVSLLLGMAVQQSWAEQPRLTPVADTFVASGWPTQSFGLDGGLWVGHGRPGGDLTNRALLGFAPGLPAGSRITSAQLRLYLAGTVPGDAPLAVQAHRVRSDWNEALTWADHLGLTVDSAPAASVNVPATLGWYTWDVTGALQAWSDSRDTRDFSLLLGSDVSSGQHFRGFWSKDSSVVDQRPSLEIVYDAPTATATPTATPTATFFPTRTATPTTAPGVQAVLRSSSNGVAHPGDEITYFVDYRAVGSGILTNVVITNAIPSGALLIPDSITPKESGSVTRGIVTWNVGTLGLGVTAGTVSYRVRIPTPTPTASPTPTRTHTPCREALELGVLYDLHIDTTRAVTDGFAYYFGDAEDPLVRPLAAIYDSNNVFIDLDSYAPCPIGVYLARDGAAIAIQAGDTVTLTRDDYTTMKVYLPAIDSDSDVMLYLGADGSTYWDAGLCTLAQAPPTPTPTRTPTPTPTRTPTGTPTKTPTGPPARTPTRTPTPAGVVLTVNASEFGPGAPMTVGGRLLISVWQGFDAYVLAVTTQGIYSLFLDGSVLPGVWPLAAGVPRLDAPMQVEFLSDFPRPAGLTGALTLYLVITEAGRVPPVRSPAEVRPDSPFVIMMDTRLLTLMP